jgi:site-specific DNA-cytosine methylase
MGHEDERHLWPAMLRIIQGFRPRWVIAENVAGHISLGFDEVAASLEAEGFTLWPFIIPASALDAPHRRDRVWIVGHAPSARPHASAQTGICDGKKSAGPRDAQLERRSAYVQLWPTPRAADGPKGGNGPSSRDLSLTQAVKIWPTPVATMHKGSSQASLTRRNGQDRSNDRLDHAVFKTNGGQLNPAWVEWLMGFPSGWTDLNALATPLCPPSPMPSDGPFCSSKTNADPE